MHIEHFNSSAPRELLLQLRDFYCFLFDLAEGTRPQFTRAGYWLYSEGKALMHLTESKAHTSANGKGFLAHLTFQTTGLQQLQSRMQSLDVSYYTEHLPEIGMTQVFFFGPGRHRSGSKFPARNPLSNHASYRAR